MPSAATSPGAAPAAASAPAIARSADAAIASASCSTSPGAGNDDSTATDADPALGELLVEHDAARARGALVEPEDELGHARSGEVGRHHLAVRGERAVVVALGLGGAAGRDAGVPGVDLAAGAVGVPVERAGHQRGGGRGGREPAVGRGEGEARAPLEHVLEVERALVRARVARPRRAGARRRPRAARRAPAGAAQRARARSARRRRAAARRGSDRRRARTPQSSPARATASIRSAAITR